MAMPTDGARMTGPGPRSAHIRLMAQYNAWMNRRLYETCAALPEPALALDRQAYFGSILGTLNHIVNGDTIWMQRFATHPAWREVLAPIAGLSSPYSLAAVQFERFDALAAHRAWFDEQVLAWAGAVAEADLDVALRYANRAGVTSTRPCFSLAMHFFNHQTHHRGQVTTLLSQAGLDVGVTDLLALVPELQD
jgi:uncharacterized damage-inducible protein DinB